MLQASELVTDLLKTLMSHTKVVVPVYHDVYFHALTVLIENIPNGYFGEQKLGENI